MFLVITKLTKQDLGGYSGEVPPLPIPNREVKLTNADCTAYLSGRVGSRLFKEQIERFAPFFLLVYLYSDIPIYYIYTNPRSHCEVGVLLFF